MSESLTVENSPDSVAVESEGYKSENSSTPKRRPEGAIEYESEIKRLSLDISHMNHEDLYEMGVSRTHTYENSGAPNDVEEAIEYFTRALKLTPDDHPSLSDRHVNLGWSYGERFQHLGQISDLERSIEHKLRAIELTPEDHPSLSVQHANLGWSYSERFWRLGQLNDLDKGIQYGIRALALASEDHPSLSDRHTSLGRSHCQRFRRLGQLEDIETSIEHYTRALVLTPDGHPSFSDRHADLGWSLNERFRRLGQIYDLERSIEHNLHALELTPDSHPAVSLRHARLGVSYTDRYRRLGRVHDLEKSIEHCTQALALTPDGHPSLSDWHTYTGVSYEDRYERTGQVDDLEKSIEHKYHAFLLTPDGHPSLSYRHVALGLSYADRYERLGQVEDLEKSIQHHTRALALTPDGDPTLPDRHGSLGRSYGERFRGQGQVDDLEKSTEHLTCAFALTPNGHPSLSGRHAELGHSYRDRFHSLGQLEDIEKSIEQYTRALVLTPDDHPYLSELHGSLGLSYRDRFEYLDQAEDLEKAKEHHTRALALTPKDHPQIPARHLQNAYIFWLQFQHTGDSSYSAHTLAAFRNASQLLIGYPREKFMNALQWANLASMHSCLDPIEAYQTTIHLLPQFVWIGTTTHQRYQDLATVQNLATSAACAAILHSDHKLALEWLEHARCVVWNQTLMLRSPIDMLQLSHPDLATRLHTVAQQLHDSGPVSSTSQIPPRDSLDLEEIGMQRPRLAKEYEDLLTMARALPGFEEFLQPMKADRLVRAARNGPVAIINCHQDRCDALVISPGQDTIQHLPLTNFTQNRAKSVRLDLEMSLRNKGVRERGFRVQQILGGNDGIARVLLALWNDVVKPVLKCLGYMGEIPAHRLPHITWCPTGALSFLPLHAAGDYSQPAGSRVFDYVVSSYVPTLTALFASSQNKPERTLRVFAIGQEHTPGHSPLPGTTAELECVANHARPTASYSQLTGGQATTADVLDAMEKHDWVHLACHAHQNVSDPTKSGFYLHDGTLDLAAINRRSFKNKGLAFLSACQTATGDENLPDEAIHLASGMLMAGYPSVIATMWSVMDDDAPLVADKVYAQLMKDGKVGNGEAGRALHNAAAALREKVGEKEFARWVPYIHIGS